MAARKEAGRSRGQRRLLGRRDQARGDEIVGHGRTNSERQGALSEADEADETVEKAPAEKKPRRQTKAARTTSRPRKGAKE